MQEHIKGDDFLYKYFNPNPKEQKVGDCVVRALCKALDLEWDLCFCVLTTFAFGMKDMPSANRVWGRMLYQNGFKRHIIDHDCTVEEFCHEHPKGTYLLAIQGHVVCCIDGDYFDSWDSGHETPLYYWEME